MSMALGGDDADYIEISRLDGLVESSNDWSMIFVKDNAIGSEPSVVHSTEAAPFNSMWRQKPNNRRQLGGEKKPQATEALQHRINERKRHKETNELINSCVNILPICIDTRETKVMLLQRVVAYFCFLENKIDTVCRELGLNPAFFQRSNVLKNTSFSAEVWSTVQNLDMDDFSPVELLNAYLDAMGFDPIVAPAGPAVPPANTTNQHRVSVARELTFELEKPNPGKSFKRQHDATSQSAASHTKRPRLFIPRIVSQTEGVTGREYFPCSHLVPNKDAETSQLLVKEWSRDAGVNRESKAVPRLTAVQLGAQLISDSFLDLRPTFSHHLDAARPELRTTCCRKIYY